jgi:PAS domain S-box-containing protein
MNEKTKDPEQSARLRKQAEKVATENATPLPETIQAMSVEEIRQMLHELQVHQIELEMQNEELRRTQVKLAAARDLYFNFYDLSPVGYFTLSEHGLILETNLTAASLLGVTRDALVNQPISRFIFNEDQPVYYAHRQTLFKTGEPQMCELRVMKRDETPFWTHLASTVVQDNARGDLVSRVVMIDITERKRALESLRESEEKYRMVADFTYDWEYWIAPDGSLPYVSPACERITGYRPEEYQQDPGLLARIVHPDDRDEFAQHLSVESTTKDVKHSHIDFRVITRSNQEIWIAHACQPVFSCEGQFRGRRVSNRDISNRKQTEAARAQLEAQHWQLQKIESLSRMAGAIAHHFNNQLNVVMGNLEMVMEDLPEGIESIELLTAALTATRKAAGVSSLMLTYIGQTDSQNVPMDICEICNLSLPLLRATVPKRILLKANFDSPGPIVNGDVNQIQQVIINLVTNGQEAVCDGLGAIELCVKTVAAMDIPGLHRHPIDWQPRDDVYACLEVADSGCGIQGTDIDKIFDPFFTSKFPGRGLGLSAVLGILKAHHGAITVKSVPGQGSIFRVFLPVSAETVTRSPEKAASTSKTEVDGSLLLVEDETDVRKMVKMMLSRLGMAVLEARDGVEAVELFRRHKNEIRIVLCDLTMPRMDGWEALAAFRELSPNIPVILYSGYDEGKVMDAPHPEQPSAFLQKPFSMKELYASIRQILAEK